MTLIFLGIIVGIGGYALLMPAYNRFEKASVNALLARHPELAGEVDSCARRFGLSRGHFSGVLLRNRYCRGEGDLEKARSRIVLFHLAFLIIALLAATLVVLGVFSLA